jgi:hypothetical protein
MKCDIPHKSIFDTLVTLTSETKQFLIMTKNMGMADKMVRTGLALVITLLYWQNIISGTLTLVLIGVAVIFLLTSTVSFCPIYKILGINSCSADTKK